jgi:hypothetical protein
MSKRSKMRRPYKTSQQVTFPVLPYAGNQRRTEQDVSSIIGMFSIKTIKTQSGKIVVHQGQQINEEILKEVQIDEVIFELLANAMPGRKA